MNEQEEIKRLAVWMGWFWYDNGLPGRCHVTEWQKDGSYIAPDRWNPKRSIADAWMLVERILKHPDNLGGCIHIEHLDGDGEDWQVSCCFELGQWKGWVSGNTAPEAICAAVLRLIEGGK